MDGYASWTPPVYDLSKPPRLRASIAVVSDVDDHNFPRSAKWSPDGSSFITHMEDRSVCVTEVTGDMLTSSATTTGTRAFKQAAPILDYAWYPTASIHDPASYCFVASVREAPVKLLDASDGRLRASYSIVDHRERQIAPYCLGFNLSAQRLYCTFEDAIEVFDISRPNDGLRLHTNPSKKSKDGLRGILSSIAFTPSESSSSSDLFAVGSLSTMSGGNIAVFSNDYVNRSMVGSGKMVNGSRGVDVAPIVFVGGGPKAGVSQLQFHPTRPHILYASFRRHEDIYAWDLRSDVETPVEVFTRSTVPDVTFSDEDIHVQPQQHQQQKQKEQHGAYIRRIWTNQRMRFGIDISGRWLGVGDQLGTVSVFDLVDEAEHHAYEGAALTMMDTLRDDDPHHHDAEAGEDPRPRPKPPFLPRLEYKGHRDAVGSVSFHPLTSTLLTVSGSRHFEFEGSESDTGPDEGNANRVEKAVDSPRVFKYGLQPRVMDDSVKLWDLS